MAESNCTRCHFCQPAFARAAIPGQELAATRRSHSKESCININEQTPPRDAPNTMRTLHPHSFSCVVWAQSSLTQRGEANTPQRVGAVQQLWNSQYCCPLLKTRNGWCQHLLQAHGKVSPMRQVSAAQRGSPKNKNNSPNPNKAKVLSSSHPPLHHPNYSNLTPHLQFLPLLTLKWQSQVCLQQFLGWSDRAPGRAQILFAPESWRTTQFSTQKRKVKSNLNC